MEVFLIRTAPGTGHEIPARSRRTPALYFFHGDGVEHALDPAAGREWAEAAAEAELDLMACETALARRTKEVLKPPWRTGSLAQFWQAMHESVARVRPEAAPGKIARSRHSSRVHVRRLQASASSAPPKPHLPSRLRSAYPGYGSQPGFVIRVNESGDDRFNREILELCLAGAALEVDLAVCFAGAGVELLKGAESAAWRQFPDFELAPLYYVADHEISLDVPARRLDDGEAGRMAEQAGRVIDV